MTQHLEPITIDDTDDDGRTWVLVTDVGTVIHKRSGQSFYARPDYSALPAGNADDALATVGPTRTSRNPRAAAPRGTPARKAPARKPAAKKAPPRKPAPRAA